MLKIRLARVGKKNSPSYRVVVAEQKMAVKRKFIEIIGNYNPSINPKQLVMNKERALFWMGQGAQPSDTIRNLMCDLGILDKKEKSQKVFGKEMTKKAKKEGGEKKPEIARSADEEDAKTEEAAPETEAPADETAEAPAESAETAEEAPAEEVAEAAPEETQSPSDEAAEDAPEADAETPETDKAE